MGLKIGKKKRLSFRNTAIALAVIAFFPIAFTWLVNQPWLHGNTLRIINFRSPTRITISSLKWNPVKSEIRIEGLGINHKTSGKDGWIKDLRVKYSPLGFLRGKLILKELEINTAQIILPPTLKDAEKKERKLNVTRLLLLHSLVIEKGTINNFAVTFGEKSTYRTDSLNFRLKPSIAGSTRLIIETQNTTLNAGNVQALSAKNIKVDASTTLSKWMSDFPYLNAITGKLTLKDLLVQNLSIDNLEARMGYEDGKIDLSKLIITMGGNSLTGAFHADINNETFDINVDIPKPITLPFIGKEIDTIDTAGELTGHIEFAGKGLLLKTVDGSGHVALTYQFANTPDQPFQTSTNFSWKKGAITTSDATVLVGEGSANAELSLDLTNKKMKIVAGAKDFPIEAVFRNFQNPQLRKLFGKTEATSTIEGWGKDFIVKASAITTEGGFEPIIGEKIETEMEATYNKLQFEWKLYQDEKQTGTGNLVIAMGQRLADGSRAKDLDLIAELKEHSLEPSFPEFNLTGTASGEITLKGSPTNFTGNAKAKIIKGSWLHLPINEASTEIDLTRYKLTFDNARITPEDLDVINLIEPLSMDILENKFRLHGNPLEGLTLDLNYQYDSKKTTIEKITYTPSSKPNDHLLVKGYLVSGGNVSLNASGDFDLSLIDPVKALIREASGPTNMNINISGPTSSPILNGKLELRGNALSLRPIRLTMEDLKGTIDFNGRRINFNELSGLIEDGSFALSGWIEHRDFKLANANIELMGKEFAFRTQDNSFRMKFDGELSLSGTFPHPLLSGSINIIDGRYTKDFTVLEQLGGKAAGEKEEEKITFDPRLKLRVYNAGELLIRNNVGDIDLKADLKITGLRSKPLIEGGITTRDGKIKYLGLNFDITNGFIEFRGPYSKPYLEVEAERELRLYNINLKLYGYTNNLSMDLEGTSQSGPLEKRDVVSLLAFGITEQERREAEELRTGKDVGLSVAAQQIGQMLERPVTEATHLDIFRIESAETETDPDEPGKIATRLKVGKQLTDRLSVDFSTDIDTKDAEQTVTTEYLITDNLLLKGSRSSENKYEINAGLRFRLR